MPGPDTRSSHFNIISTLTFLHEIVVLKLQHTLQFFVPSKFYSNEHKRTKWIFLSNLKGKLIFLLTTFLKSNTYSNAGNNIFFQCIVVLGSSGPLTQEWTIKVTIATSGSQALAITNCKRN